jgi:CDP-glycerol glycerophosphotransferase
MNLSRSIKKRIFKLKSKLIKQDANAWCFIPYGDDFTGNIKAVFEYSVLLNVKVIILTSSKSFEKYNDKAIIINDVTATDYFKSSVIICDQLLSVYTFFRKYNFSPKKIINVWHGIPMKKMFLSSINPISPFIQNEKEMFHIIASSELDAKAMEKSFGVSPGNIHITGLPRIDYLSNLSDSMKDEEFKINQLTNGKKLILFAPTWRDDNGSYYEFTQEDLNLLSDFLDKNNCVIGVREHFNHKNKSYYNQLKKVNVLNLNNDYFKNIEVLLKKADLLITDYSSCYFDFLFLKKPCVSFAFDYQEYGSHERGFLHDPKELFGQNLCFDFHHVLLRAEELMNKPYSIDMDTFNRFYKFDDNKNSERVIDIIKNIVKG